MSCRRVSTEVAVSCRLLSAFGSCCDVQATSEGLLSKIMEITMPFSSSVRYCGYGAGINLSTCPRATLFNPPLIKSTKIASLLPLYVCHQERLVYIPIYMQHCNHSLARTVAEKMENDVLKCPYCKNDFDTENRAPLSRECGESMCSACSPRSSALRAASD